MNEWTDGLMQFHNNLSLFISSAFKHEPGFRENAESKNSFHFYFYSEEENKRFDKGREGCKTEGKEKNKNKMKGKRKGKNE